MLMAHLPMNTLHSSLPWRHHLREILRLGVPLVGNNLALAAMGTVDTLMSGRLGSRSLAAVAVGVSFYNLFLFAAVGVMMAVLMGVRDPQVLARACDLGVAMQLSNIARDVGEDARAGRIYIPLKSNLISFKLIA